MKRLSQPLSIKKNLLLFFWVFFCVPFLSFCLIWYAKSAKTIEESGIYYNEQLIRRVSTQLDEYFNGIKADSMALPGHLLVQQFIKADPYNTYEMYLLKGRISNELLPNLRKDIYDLTLISDKGAAYGDLITLQLPLKGENFKILGITEKNDVPVITVYRKIIDNVTYTPAGAVLMSLSLQQMLKIADLKPYGKNGYIVIANEEGRIIYHTDRNQWGKLLPEGWSQKINSASGRFEEDGEEGKKHMVYQISPATKFTIIAETSKSELLGGLIHLQLMTLLIGALILALAFVIFYRMFREVKRLLLEIHTTRMREKELELRNREALVAAVQSQINPHFLYNALEIINSYAMLFNIHPISQMTVHLSNMFRYSVSDPDQVVSLRKELEYIHHYIRIQEERFDDFKFELNVDDEMQDKVYLFRLTLQPLIENAFQHAYEEQGLSPTKITIDGTPEAEYYSIYIRDAGRGMPEEVMQKYNEAFASISEATMLRVGFKPFPAIGLWNVHSRLRLAFGRPYGIHITHSDERGSQFQVILPYTKGVMNNVQSADCG